MSFVLCQNLYLFMCGTCMHMYVDKRMQRPEGLCGGGGSLGWVSSPVVLYPVPLSYGHSLNLNLLCWLEWLTSKFLGSICAPTPSHAEVTDTHGHVWLFSVLEISLKSLFFHSKGFLPTELSP